MQLLVKLFNLELKDNDPIKLASEIKAIFHDIESTGVKVDLKLTTFIKVLYPTNSNYLELLQASGQMKAMTFDVLVDKIAERENAFGKKESLSNSTVETLCIAQKEQNPRGESTRPDHSSRGCGRITFRGKGVIIIKMTDDKNMFRMIDNMLNDIDVVNLVILPVIVALLGKRLLRRKINNL